MKFTIHPYSPNNQKCNTHQTGFRFGNADFERRKRILPNAQTLYDSSDRIVQNLDRADQFLRQHQPQLGLAVFEAIERHGEQSEQVLSAQIKHELHKVRQANFDLAKDIHNERAKAKLKEALQYLKEHHYFNNNALIAPQVVHGYANLGTYTFNNNIYKGTVARLTPQELQDNMDDFEGLFIETGHYTPQQKQIYINKIKEELPYLEKAIRLTDRMIGTPQARLLAKAEYLTAKGHVYHGLAHLSPKYFNAAWRETSDSPFLIYSKISRQAFHEATCLLADYKRSAEFQNSSREDQIVVEDLLFKLLTQKNKHLCESDGPHKPQSKSQVNSCGIIFSTLPTEGEDLVNLKPRFDHLHI